MDNKSLIKNIQRGLIKETKIKGTILDIKINPVNIDKSIFLFNSSVLNLNTGTGIISNSPLAYLKDEDTIRFIGCKYNDMDSIIPYCYWQVIEFN